MLENPIGANAMRRSLERRLMNELALFAGAGGGILGGHLLGWTPVGAVEIEKYPRECLLQRQRDGILPPFPIWDDVTTFDGKPWRGLVDVVSGGFPCQDISCAGKGEGISGSRSGLWKEMYRIICEVRPRYAFMENSPLLTSRGLHVVLGDLAEAGYDAAWLVLAASDVGAPHQRKRIWILAVDRNTDSFHVCTQSEVCRRSTSDPVRVCSVIPNSDLPRTGWGSSLPSSAESHRLLSDTHLPGCQEQRQPQSASSKHQTAKRCGWWGSEPNVGRVADGVASRVDRLKAIGNGQVPLVAAQAFTILHNILNHV